VAVGREVRATKSVLMTSFRVALHVSPEIARNNCSAAHFGHPCATVVTMMRDQIPGTPDLIAEDRDPAYLQVSLMKWVFLGQDHPRELARKPECYEMTVGSQG